MRSSLLALAVLLLSCGAQAALTPNAEKALDEGLIRLYSLDYEESRAAFRRLIEREPDNPFGYLFESGAIWWQSSMEFGLFKDTPTLQGLFEQDVEAALRKSDPLMDSHDKLLRADGFFVSGMTLGTRGQWGLMRGHWLDAYFDGKKAIKHLKKCVKLDEDYNDAYLGLGVFDYQAAHMPGLLKLSALLGVRGDEERGLARITQAMEKGRYGSRQSAQFLTSIYIIDKHDYGRALTVVDRLRKEFPRSPYFLFLETFLRHRMGDWDGSLRQSRELFEVMQSSPASFGPKLLSLVCGLSGDKCLDAADARATLTWFDHAVEGTDKEKPSAYQTMLHLYRGEALDLLGNREEAVKEYRKALGKPDFLDFHARAQDCLAEACTRAQTLEYLRAFSKHEPWPYKKPAKKP